MDAVRRSVRGRDLGIARRIGKLRRVNGITPWLFAAVVLLVTGIAVVAVVGMGWSADHDEVGLDSAGLSGGAPARVRPGLVAGGTANRAAADGATDDEAEPVGQPAAVGNGGVTAAGVQVAPSFDRKVMRSATVGLTVEDVDAAVVFVRDAAAAAGGYVFSSSSSYQGEQEYGQITVRVPFAQFDAVLNRLREAPGLVRVDSEATSSQDVTLEYVDAESRIRNLEATEGRLLALMDQAAAIDDVIALQGQLTGVRGEIETLKGRLAYLADATDFSTITVTLVPVPPAATSDKQEAERSLVRAARGAWLASLAVVEGAATVAVQVVVFLWWLVPLGLLGYAVARVVRRDRRGPAAATTSGGPSAAG